VTQFENWDGSVCICAISGIVFGLDHGPIGVDSDLESNSTSSALETFLNATAKVSSMPVLVSEDVQQMNDADFIKKNQNEILDKLEGLAASRSSTDLQTKLKEPVSAWEWVKRIGAILGILGIFLRF
jgi:hypothetical protein